MCGNHSVACAFRISDAGQTGRFRRLSEISSLKSANNAVFSKFSPTPTAGLKQQSDFD
jgi:hypothetical protein